MKTARKIIIISVLLFLPFAVSGMMTTPANISNNSTTMSNTTGNTGTPPINTTYIPVTTPDNFTNKITITPCSSSSSGSNWGIPTTNNPLGPYKDPNGNIYDQYREFNITAIGSSPLYNVPIEISPTFQDLTCNASSVRILYENSSGYIEMPYQNTSLYVYYPSGYLKTVSITFVVPEIQYTNFFRIYWSWNSSISAPGYTVNDYTSIPGESITNFTYQSNSTPNVGLQYSTPGSNMETDILVKSIGSNYNQTYNSSQFNIEGEPEFIDAAPTINLGSGYQNKSPVALKMVDGTNSSWGAGNWLVVGVYNGTLIYKFNTGSDSFDSIANYTMSGSPNCASVQVGNVIGNASYEILLGCSNGSVIVLNFDGTSSSLYALTIFTDNYTTTDRNAYGIGLINAYANNTSGEDQIIVATSTDGTGSYLGSLGFYNVSYANPTEFNLLKGNSNTFYSRYAYENSDFWAPNVYVANFNPMHSGDEYLVATRSPTGKLALVMGGVTINETYGNDTTGDAFVDKQLMEGNLDTYYGTDWAYTDVATLGSNQMTALAYSTNLMNGQNYNIITGSSNGWLYWYNLTVATSTEMKLVGGSGSYDYDFGSNAGALQPITGNFDNVSSAHDDVVVASSNGYLYFMKYNSVTNNLQYINKQFIKDTNFTGNGHSITQANLLGNGENQLILAGSDGKIRIMQVSMPTNITIHIGSYNATNPEFSQTGINAYNNSLCSEFQTSIVNYINSGNYSRTTDGQYIIIPVNITTSTPGSIYLSNLNIQYTTNDYSIVEKNQGVIFSDPTLNTAKLVNLDNDHDNYPDIYEHLNIMWSPNASVTEIPVYLNHDGIATWIKVGDPLPSSYHLNPYCNDTDHDGLLDGDEIDKYYTNPMMNDTSNDGITDYDEIFGIPAYPGSANLLGPICAVNPDPTNNNMNNLFEIQHHCNPHVNDTDGDGLTDYQEIYKYHSNPNCTDSNGMLYPNGTQVTDYIESGINPSLDLHNIIDGQIRFYSWPELNLTSNDSDGDGLTDAQEIFGITEPYWANSSQNYVYYTDPTKADTDGDGVSDYQEVMGRYVTWTNWTYSGNGHFNGKIYTDEYTFYNVTQFMRTDPQNPDTDGDGLTDGQELTYHCNPLCNDTDRDGLSDGDEALGKLTFPGYGRLYLNATNPDTDGDGLPDGVEYYGIGYVVGTHSNPCVVDTDGDGWTDYQEVKIYFTNPDNPDSDGDGIIDSKDPMPMLATSMAIFTYCLVAFGFVAIVISYPLNKKAAKTAGRARVEYQKKIKSITTRLQRERIERDRITAFARMMPSNLESGKINVKINLRINDESFYCRQSKIWYSAGADEFREAMMDHIDDLNFSIVLANIPLDMTVLYYFELLDKGGVWLKQLKDEAEQRTYEFSTSKSGVKEPSDWEDPNLIKCEVCGYMCRKEWDSCPECNTPLHDTTQEIFIEDQIAKEEKRARESDADEMAWQEAQATDEIWRGLPECPSCGFTVQEDWSRCPVCNFDLTAVELKKKAVYDDIEEDMDYVTDKEHETLYDDTSKMKSAKETKKEMEEEKKKKEKKEADEWGSDDEDRDIL